VLGGFTTFRTDSRGRVVFPDTQIDPAFKGRGLGTTLVADAMTDAAKRGDTVVPECTFVARYLSQNEVAGLAVDWPETAED
jgi:predicted GNAT family acetyltransferase